MSLELYVYALVLMFWGYFTTQHPELLWRMKWFPFFQHRGIPKIILAAVIIQGWLSIGFGFLLMVCLLFL